MTLFVNEADKNKIMEMLQRAKSVISKKVEKVMGRKTAKLEISHADALKTVLQNWVEEEEIKSVQVRISSVVFTQKTLILSKERSFLK